MKLKVGIHEAEEGGYWADVPALPGCVSQGETLESPMVNLREAVEGWLAVEVLAPPEGACDRVVELAIRSRGAARSSRASLNGSAGC
jgi:predicted RNase H-like HicB family nuclease